MNMLELENHTAASNRYSYEEASIEGPDGEEIKGVIVSDSKVDTAIHITFGALLKLDWSGLCAAAAQGRDVDHITRVTGYFSRTSGYNPGKRQELKDRHRVRVE